MLAIRIAKLRDKNNLTQAELAKRLNITQQTYSSYETGKRQMNYEMLCHLADIYNVTTDYLLGRQETIPSFLSEDERCIIDQYRTLDERGKESVKANLAFEYLHVSKSKGTIAHRLS